MLKGFWEARKNRCQNIRLYPRFFFHIFLICLLLYMHTYITFPCPCASERYRVTNSSTCQRINSILSHLVPDYVSLHPNIYVDIHMELFKKKMKRQYCKTGRYYLTTAFHCRDPPSATSRCRAALPRALQRLPQAFLHSSHLCFKFLYFCNFYESVFNIQLRKTFE